MKRKSMKRKVLEVIAIILICYLPGIIIHVFWERKPDLSSQENSVEHKSDLSSQGNSVLPIGEHVNYHAPKEIRMYGQGKCIIIAFGYHQAYILEYHSRPNTYTIGIELAPQIFFEIKNVDPKKLSRIM